MPVVSIDKLKVGKIVSSEVYLEPEHFILLCAGCPLPAYLNEVVQRWSLKQIQTKLEEQKKSFYIPKSYLQKNAAQIIENDLRSYLDFLPYLNNFRKHCEQILQNLITKNILEAKALDSLLQKALLLVTNYQTHILRLSQLSDINLPINTCLLTIALAYRAKLPKHRIMSAATTAMLGAFYYHQINSKIAASNTIRMLMSKQDLPHHTIKDLLLIFDMLEERENKEPSAPAELGYVVLSYCQRLAQLSTKVQESPHTIILELIRNSKNLFNVEALKLLLDALTLYPLGSYVMLENNLIALSFLRIQDNPRYPTVQLLQDAQQEIIEEPILVLTGAKQPISKALNYSEFCHLSSPYQEIS